MSVDEIYNARTVDDRLTTSGQPTEAQLHAAAAEGFDTVVNLAPHEGERALPDEAGLVRELGMTYHHVPVVFADPTEDDFSAFERVLTELPADGRTLVHCTANFRVSAFYALYAMKHLGWSAERAHAFRASVWDVGECPAWNAFVSRIEERLGFQASGR